MADLLGIPQTRYTALATLAPPERRTRTLDVLATYALNMAAGRPAAWFFEDLQWADPTTRDWLGRVLRRLDEAPLLALIAVRSDARPDLLDTDTFHRLPLERLRREESAEIIDLVTEGSTLDAQLREKILVATDGVPLFVEELTKVLLEAQGASPFALADRQGRPRRGHPSHHSGLPDRPSRPPGRGQAGGAGGGHDRARVLRDLLAAVTRMPEPELTAALARLQSSGLVLLLDAMGERLAFKHALVRDAAYDGLLRATRRSLHARIVEALEASFPQ